jgi:hypothetical protein
MKRIFTVLTLIVYFLVSTGFAVSVHYCMDEIDSVEIGTESDNECNRCGMEVGDNKCCRDEVKVHKLQTSHVVSKALQLNFSIPALITATADLTLSPFRNFKPLLHTIAHSPPLPGQDILIENCVFRI